MYLHTMLITSQYSWKKKDYGSLDKGAGDGERQ